MRRRIRSSLPVLSALLLVPALLAAQTDSLRVGDRVRITVPSSRLYQNVFVGNVDRLSGDTLVLALPGARGSVILPRAAISVVSKSVGSEPRWKSIRPFTLLMIAPVAIHAARPVHRGTPHWASLRNERYVLIGISAFPIGRAIVSRTPQERWQPVYPWLERW